MIGIIVSAITYDRVPYICRSIVYDLDASPVICSRCRGRIVLIGIASDTVIGIGGEVGFMPCCGIDFEDTVDLHAGLGFEFDDDIGVDRKGYTAVYCYIVCDNIRIIRVCPSCVATNCSAYIRC